MKQTAIIIPARYGSSRLEGKPLLRANNKPKYSGFGKKLQNARLLTGLLLQRMMKEFLMYAKILVQKSK